MNDKYQYWKHNQGLRGKSIQAIISKVAVWVSKDHKRIYALLIPLILLPIGLFAYSAGRLVRKQNEKQAAIESKQIALLTSTVVETHFHQSAAFMQSIANRPDLWRDWKHHNLAGLKAQLENTKKLRSDFLFASIYSPDCTMRAVYPDQPDLIGRNFGYRDWCKGVQRSWSPYVSEVYQTSVSPHSLVVAIAVPIRDEHGSPRAVLMSAYALDTISQLLVETNLESNWTVSLVDQNGYLSAHPHIDSQQPAINLSAYEPVQLVRKSQAGHGIFFRNGSSFLVGYTPIREYGWGILVEKPVTVLEQGVWDIERQVWVLGIAFLGVGVLFGSFLASLYSQMETGNHFLDLSVDMFCVAGFDGYFKRLNPSWEKVLGFSEAELTAKPYIEFVHPEDCSSTAAGGSLLQKGDAAIAFENRYLHKDGSYRWLLWNAVSVPKEKLVYAVAHDITDRKKTEERIERQNRELELRNREVERNNRMKSRFLASMSHELRTPLNAIMGFSELLTEGTAGPLTEKQKRFLGHVRNGSVHLLQLINDILDLSKLEADQMEFQNENCSVVETLPEVLSTVRPLTGKKNIEIKQDLMSNVSVYADRIRFKQILYNLLSNAVKFTPDGGHIEIECHREGENVSLSVKDDGIGIDSDNHAAIFEEFRQLGDQSQAANEGTGLGLAITRRIVQAQGGTIFVESAIGKGSRFTFTLPAEARPTSQTMSAASESEPVAPIEPKEIKPLLLIVGNDLASRELLASFLSSEYRIAFAMLGDEAIEKTEELKPDGVILDVVMEDADGMDVLAKLRKKESMNALPILVVSILEQKKAGLSTGATDYIVKPVKKSELLLSIHKYVAPQIDDDSTILLVDDDPQSLDLLEETLRSAGYETESVRSGARALEVLSAKIFSAVFVDLVMPGMDGFQVIGRIREQGTLKDLPIFVVTAKTLTEQELIILGKETQSFFQKTGPWRQQVMVEINRVMQEQMGKAAKAAGS
jgi:PAS domain S-box-containing protein